MYGRTAAIIIGGGWKDSGWVLAAALRSLRGIKISTGIPEETLLNMTSIY
jgi:hypothetical protein